MDAEVLRLEPGQWTPVPDSGVEIRWDGDEPVAVYRPPGGPWNVAALTRESDRVLAWERLARRPDSGMWPLAWPFEIRGTVYRSRTLER